MSDSEHQDPFKSLDDFVDKEELKNEMESLDNLIGELQDEEVAAPVQTPEPTISWSDTSHELAFAPETVERWKTERPRLVNNTVEQENVANHICQQCGSNPVAVRCRDCRPSPFFCAECDVGMHTRHVLHNRDAMIAGFFQPLPPSTVVVDNALSRCAVRFEVDNIVKEERFICPACSPDMLAVLVDGNRKHYRFKNSARSEEQAMFEGVFISKDEDVAKCVDYTHSTTKHVSGRGVCGGEWSADRETSKRSTSKLDEEGLELAVKWSGAYQDGAGLTHGEEEEQCNAFLSRIAVTTKHMSKAGRTDMLTLLVMRWNQQNINNLATSLSHRYQKLEEGAVGGGCCWRRVLLEEGAAAEGGWCWQRLQVMTAERRGGWRLLTVDREWRCQTTKALQSQMQALETMKAQLAVTESQLEDWVNDVKEWAEDGNKARARIRCKIRKEKEILTSVVASYNRMVPSTETLCLENILSEEENAWPWQLPHSDLPWVLSEEGLRGLQSTILRKRQKITERKLQARACYLQVLSGAENVNFLHRASADDYDSDSDSNMD
ncbi:hypothetical protein NQZ68_019297 [Dissostichus eleginoides]|nr:hypothetical protein NQZ68_019297 [Dissostichus eleginoides]